MKKEKMYGVGLLIVLALVGYFVYDRSITSITKTSYKMGTLVKVKVYSSRAENIVEDAFKVVDNLEKKMSLQIESSEINKINKMAGKEAVRVSDDTYQVISKALEYAKLSKGLFDPTIGPLVKLWGIGTENQRVPSENELKEKLKLVDYKRVRLYPKDKKVMLLKKGMILDVGGIAKGYAADKVIQFFKDRGVKKAFISLGGNISVLGTKRDDSLWKIGIQDPKKSRGQVMASVELKDKTVVTSGNYERYFMEDGVRYHHILNPNTAKPARNGIISATIIDDSSLDADALSTVLYILGVKEGFKLINSIPNVEALVVTEDSKIYLTEKIKDKVNLSKDDK